MAHIPFSSWTEVDPNSKLSQTSLVATWANMIRNEACYLHVTRTVTAEFIHYLDFRVSSIDVNADASSNILAYIWVVCENAGRPAFVEIGKSIKLSVLEKGNSTTLYQLYLSHKDDNEQDTSSDLNVGTTYYLTITKSSAVVTCVIYSDSARTTTVDTITIDLTGEDEENMSFSVIETTASFDSASDGNDQSDGYVENLILLGSGGGITVGGVTIGDDDTCERITDINIEEGVTFESKEILGKDTPTINPDNYVTTGKIWTITMRMTKTNRDALQAEKDNHDTILFSIQAGETDYVKLEDLNYRWAGNECFSCPWLVTMTIVSVLY